MKGRVAEDLPRDLFIFHDEKNRETSKLSRVFGATILDQVFDQLDPNKKNLRDILNDLRLEIKTGGADAINFPVLSVNDKTGEVVLTPSDIGLGLVNNTSDMMKPLSNPQREAIMTILRAYRFNVNLDKYDQHLLNTENPHDVTVDQLDKDQELTAFVNRHVAKRLYEHSKHRALYVHKDIREEIKTERLRVDDLQSLTSTKFGEISRDVAELFRMSTLHDTELSKRELTVNKVNVFREDTNNSHQYYPSTRATIEFLNQRLKELNLITEDGIIADIQVIETAAELPEAKKANYRKAFIIKNGRGSKTDVAICRKLDTFYYWEVNDIGAYSKFDDRYFIDTSRGMSLNLQAIFNAITSGEGLLQEIYSTEGRDTVSGFNGYTYSVENHNALGEVNTIIFSIPFKVVKAGKPVVTVKGNYKAQMGDGSLIELSNPIVVGVTNATASIQFTMATPYPSDSPSILVFTNADSKIIIDGTLNAGLLNDAGVGQEQYAIGGDGTNVMSGFYGLTLESDPPNQLGEVQKVVIGIPFKRYKKSIPQVTLTGNFSVRMGDGTIIPVFNPQVVDTTLSSVSVSFTMNAIYPSNSPCMLCYADYQSVITITGDDKSQEITPPNTPDPNNPNTPTPPQGGCDCSSHLLTFNNIRSISITPGTMDGYIRYYVNNDMATSKEIRVPGLHSMAFQEYIIDSNIPNNLITERHMGNNVITSRMITDKAVFPKHMQCRRNTILGNVLNDDNKAHEVTMQDLYRAILDYGVFEYNPQEMVVSPHLWVPNTVYDLHDQSYGIRFKGTISVLQNMEITTLLSDKIKLNEYQLVDAGGSWFYSTSPNAQAILGGSNITGFTFATILLTETGLLFTSISTGNRVNASYDIWVRYIDPSKIG